jgi:hypothetical protein
MDRNHLKAVSGSVALCLLLSACATPQGNDQLRGAGVGAAGGALLGCAIGLLVAGGKGCAKGAAIGAVSGVVAGWGAVKVSQYQASQVRDIRQDQQIYGRAAPVDSAQVKIRKGTVQPKTVRPGESVKISTDYSVMLPRREQTASVTESWALMRDNNVLANVPGQGGLRTPGGFAADATIPIPRDAKPGTYVIEHRVAAGSSYDTDESVFVVSR